MPTNITGNPNVAFVPSPAPAPGAIPTVAVPVDGEAGSAGSIAQSNQALTGYVAHIQRAVGLDVPVIAASGSGFTALTVNTTGGTITPSGSVHNNDGTRFVIQIQTGGIVGTATFKTSIDGGNTYGALQTTAASMTDATSGITLAFSGTFSPLGVAFFRSAYTPLAMWSDASGNVRHLIDHNGYPVGRRGEYRQEWGGGIITGALFTNPDSVSTGGSATYPSSIANRTGGTTNATNYVILTNALTHSGFTGLSLVLEMDAAFSTLAATNTTLFAGLTDSIGPAGATNLIGFQRLVGGTNWQAVLTGSAALDLGVTPTTSVAPPQRLRLEVHGSASPYGSGGNGKIRCWVNDVLKGEIAGAIPSAIMAICVGAGVSGGVASGGTNTSCGALYMTWNRVLSLPAL